MKVFVVVLLVCILAGCAAGPNSLKNSPDEKGKVAGFWHGLWQGLIAPITFVISLFTKAVGIYESHNNGGWYNLGFVLGACFISLTITLNGIKIGIR